MRRLERRYPQLWVSVRIENSAIKSQLLNERKVDIAVASEPDIEPHVQEVLVGRNELGWCAGLELDLPPAGIEGQRLAAERLMVIPPPSRLYDIVVDWFTAAGVEPLRMSTCNDLSVMAMAIAEGAVVGVVPVRVMALDPLRARVRRLDIAPPLRTHQVSICYESAGFAPGIEAVDSVARQLTSDKALFAPA